MQTVMFWLTALIFCLIRFPSIYIIPFAKSSLFLTHNIARAAIIILFLLALTVKRNPFTKPQRLLLGVIAFYFFCASISVIAVDNIGSFFTVYKDLVISLMFGYGVYVSITKENLHRFFIVMLATTIIALIGEFLIYRYSAIFVTLFSNISNESYYSFFSYQFDRSRVFGDTFNEVLMPLFFVAFTEGGLRQRIPAALFFCLSLFSTFVSGWRTKAMMFAFAFIASLVAFSRKHMLQILAAVFIIMTMVSVANQLILSTGRVSIVERFFDLDSAQIKNDSTRLTYWKQAVDISLSSPVIGVGLGNFYDHLSQHEKMNNNSSRLSQTGRFVLINDPHDMFFSALANTGFLGLFSLIALTVSFFLADLMVWRQADNRLRSFIIAFWALFIYATLNPWMYFAYLVFFWFLRGLIEKTKALYCVPQ